MSRERDAGVGLRLATRSLGERSLVDRAQLGFTGTFAVDNCRSRKASVFEEKLLNIKYPGCGRLASIRWMKTRSPSEYR